MLMANTRCFIRSALLAARDDYIFLGPLGMAHPKCLKLVVSLQATEQIDWPDAYYRRDIGSLAV